MQEYVAQYVVVDKDVVQLAIIGNKILTTILCGMTMLVLFGYFLLQEFLE